MGQRCLPRGPKFARLDRAEVPRKFCGISMEPYPIARAKGQQLMCDCRSACCEDCGLKDEGQAMVWFDPINRSK